MAFRIFIVPIEIVLDVRQPKYLPATPYAWTIIDYGSENTSVAIVHDMSPVDHTALAAETDVMALTENLDNLMTVGAVNAAQTFLENLNIPAGWINTTRTTREVIKIVIGLFQFVQRWNGLTGGSSPFQEGVVLNTQYGNMSTNTQDTVKAVFDTMVIDRTSLTNTSTIRDALFLFGDQIATRPMPFGGVLL